MTFINLNEERAKREPEAKAAAASGPTGNRHNTEIVIDGAGPGFEFEFDDKTGKPLKNEFNVQVAFRRTGVQVALNEFSNKYRIDGLPPYGPDLDDDAFDELFLTFERGFGVRLAERDFERIVKSQARQIASTLCATISMNSNGMASNASTNG